MTDDRTQAISLHYDEQQAPTITARGAGRDAEEILALAREHGIPIEENPALLAALAEVPLGEEIPAALYWGVAEILAFVFQSEPDLGIDETI